MRRSSLLGTRSLKVDWSNFLPALVFLFVSLIIILVGLFVIVLGHLLSYPYWGTLLLLNGSHVSLLVYALCLLLFGAVFGSPFMVGVTFDHNDTFLDTLLCGLAGGIVGIYLVPIVMQLTGINLAPDPMSRAFAMALLVGFIGFVLANVSLIFHMIRTLQRKKPVLSST